MTSNWSFWSRDEEFSEKIEDESPGTVARIDRHAFGDGTIASAESYEDIAILVLGDKDISDLRHRYAVYTLLCRSNFGSEQGAVVHAMNRVGDLTDSQIDRLKQGVHAPIVFYVGQSSNVIKRLYDHVHSRGCFFTKVFSPYEIVSIDWYDTEANAREAEKERAVELGELNESAYVGGGR